MKKTILKASIILFLTIVTIALLLPSAVNASVTTACRFYGKVMVDGTSAPAGSTVTAWIDDAAAGPWSTNVYFSGGVSLYVLDIPANTGDGTKNGGVTGDVVNFMVTVEGTDIPAPSGVFKKTSNVRNNLYVETPTFPALEITTELLPDGAVGVPYTCTVEATGGVMPYMWGANGLPDGLIISAEGVISGTPTMEGDYNVEITVDDSFAPPNSTMNAFNLHIDLPPLDIINDSLPGGKVGTDPTSYYSVAMAATGGVAPYSWSAAGLPNGLSMSVDGEITGYPQPLEADYAMFVDNIAEYTVDITANDSGVASDSVMLTLELEWVRGDANGDGLVTIADVTTVELVILNLATETPGADANNDGNVTIADVTMIELIILGLA